MQYLVLNALVDLPVDILDESKPLKPVGANSTSFESFEHHS